MVPDAAIALVATNTELRGAGLAPLGKTCVVVLIGCSKYQRLQLHQIELT